MNRKQIEEQGYIITHHLRDLDRYILPYIFGAKVRVYALLRDRQRYATITAFAGKDDWSEEVQARIRNLMLKACPPIVEIGKYHREPRVEIGPRMARAYHVIPFLAEQLCKELVGYLRTLHD